MALNLGDWGSPAVILDEKLEAEMAVNDPEMKWAVWSVWEQERASDKKLPAQTLNAAVLFHSLPPPFGLITTAKTNLRRGNKLNRFDTRNV